MNLKETLGIVLCPALLSLGLFSTAPATATAAAVKEVFDQTYPLEPSGRVSVENVNGNVRILSWDKPEIQVHASKQGNTREQVEAAKILIDAKPDRISIRTKYESAGLKVNRQGNSARVDYELRVPKQANLAEIETVNGNIELAELAGAVEAKATNGRVTAEGLQSKAVLQGVNASVRATFTSISGPVTAKVVNGSIEVALPRDSNAEVSGRTVNGRIRPMEGPQNYSRTGNKSRLTAKLGNGEIPVKLETVNGNIEIDLHH